jgi:hypothetical protein
MRSDLKLKRDLEAQHPEGWGTYAALDDTGIHVGTVIEQHDFDGAKWTPSYRALVGDFTHPTWQSGFCEAAQDALTILREHLRSRSNE